MACLEAEIKYTSIEEVRIHGVVSCFVATLRRDIASGDSSTD